MGRTSFPNLPSDKTDLFKELYARKENDVQWQKGRSFSYVYYANPELIDSLKKAYEMYFSENALNPAIFPSLRKMSAEVVDMCLDLFNAKESGVGLLTSGGTESILMAVRSAIQYSKKKTDYPEIILPSSAHPAFHKACDYFGAKAVVVPVDEDYRADPELIKYAMTKDTILIVASAPSYPQGVVDPVPEIAKIAKENNLLCHVDACVGGFVLPFLPNSKFMDFDMSVDGVTSLSADIHKYGFASKGSSVILYNNPELRRAQYYVYSDWAGGIYASPSILGTRPGGPIAVAWTVLKLLGREGYCRMVAKTMDTCQVYIDFLSHHEGISIVGKPDSVIFSIESNQFNIFELGDELSEMGWHLDRQNNPDSLHLSISPIHVQYFDEFSMDFTIAYKKITKDYHFHSVRNKMLICVAKSVRKVLPRNLFEKITKRFEVKGKRSATMYGIIGDLKEEGELDDKIIEFLDQLMNTDGE